MTLERVEWYDVEVEPLWKTAHARRQTESMPEQRCEQHWKMVVEEEDGLLADAGEVEVRAEPRARRRVETLAEPKCGEPKLYIYIYFFFFRAALDL